jgi:hypothetical protein
MTPIANANDRRVWIVRLLTAVLLSVTLVACASTQIRYSQLAVLNKGMSPAQTSIALDQPPLSVHEVSEGGKTYTFHRYALFNGVYSDLYLLCFEQDKLKFWGYLEEFRRYPDSNVNRAAEKALDQILETQPAR